MTTRAKNWIIRQYLVSARWIEEESNILVMGTFSVLTSAIALNGMLKAYDWTFYQRGGIIPAKWIDPAVMFVNPLDDFLLFVILFHYPFSSLNSVFCIKFSRRCCSWDVSCTILGEILTLCTQLSLLFFKHFTRSFHLCANFACY